MYKIIYILSLLFFTTLQIHAQENQAIPVYEKAIDVPDNLIKPYPHNMEHFLKYVEKKVRISKPTISQKIYILFIVEKDGSLSNIGFSEGTEEKTKIKLLKAMKKYPKWNPGKMDGKPVRVSYSLPVGIKLNN